MGLKNCCAGSRGTAGKFEGVSLVILLPSSIYYRAHEKIGPPHIRKCTKDWNIAITKATSQKAASARP